MSFRILLLVRTFFSLQKAGVPAFSHFVLSFEVRCGCKHFGKTGSSCVCMSCMWFRIEVHLATLSWPEEEEAAVQCMCFFYTRHPFLKFLTVFALRNLQNFLGQSFFYVPYIIIVCNVGLSQEFLDLRMPVFYYTVKCDSVCP